jgi:hypothetical protein
LICHASGQEIFNESGELLSLMFVVNRIVGKRLHIIRKHLLDLLRVFVAITNNMKRIVNELLFDQAVVLSESI